MLLEPENLRVLSENGRIFCLVATPEEIYHRVAGDSSRIDRPLLQVADPKQRIIELLDERGPDYARFTQVTTDQLEPDAIAQELADLWLEYDTP
jgi:shikimate kinase